MLLQTLARGRATVGAVSSLLRLRHPTLGRTLCLHTPMHRTLLGQLDWNFIPAVPHEPEPMPIPTISIVNEILNMPSYPLIGFDPSALQLMPSREYNPHWRKRKSKHGFLR